jgi:hypothetical protein
LNDVANSVFKSNSKLWQQVQPQQHVNWRSLPAWALSIGLHGILLFLPLLNDKKAAQSVAETPVVETTVTRLPTPKPLPSPKVSPLKPLPPPLPAQLPAPLSAMPDLTEPAPVVDSSNPVETRKPAAPAPKPEATPQQPSQPEAPPASNVNIPFADFPHLPGAQAACGGVCHQLTGNFREMSQTIEAQMQARGYRVTRMETMEEDGQRIFELTTQDGNKRFLSILSDAVGSTTYLLSTAPVTLRDLNNVAADRTTLAQALDQVAPTDANANQFRYPTAFFNGTRAIAGIEGRMRLVPSAPNQLLATLKSQLQSNQFSLEKVGDHGGGELYVVNRKAFSGYLSIVPTKDGAGSIIVFWSNPPT